MHNTTADIRPKTVIYRERLSPSLWALVSAAVCAPMAALVFVPLDATIALIVGVVVGIAIVAGLVAISPVIEVAGQNLRVGRARIEVRYLGDADVFVGADARQARGPGLSARSWHIIRGGIDGVVRIPILDMDDPVDAWVVSSRTPDRLKAAIRRAQAEA